ncbi:MAG: hypothetical protein LBT99_03125 [Bifidobacteriaceae bacterium]|jgi:hypothetical protein|nr:hypothetical protein [Bifidobacteriaceae bacterium]
MNIKKYGVVISAFLLAILGFINSCFTQVNAAPSSTVLPVAKGGTGANSASGARTNLNAQETLVSGTNIKSVFNNSLLGSGNITDFVYSTNLNYGQKTYFSINTEKTVNNITFSYSKRTISFMQRHWSASYLQTHTSDNTTSILSKYTYNDSETAEFKLPYLIYASGRIFNESWQVFDIVLTLNGNNGLTVKMERIE